MNKWIIDGFGPLKIIESRFQKSDVVVFIRFPLWRNYWWCFKRQIKGLFFRRSELLALAQAQAGIVRARLLSEGTIKNIKQNLFFAFIYNTAGIPIAAGILYPVFGILLSPMIAAAAMSLSSVSVIGNALRLKRMKLKHVF